MTCDGTPSSPHIEETQPSDFCLAAVAAHRVAASSISRASSSNSDLRPLSATSATSWGPAPKFPVMPHRLRFGSQQSRRKLHMVERLVAPGVPAEPLPTGEHLEVRPRADSL